MKCTSYWYSNPEIKTGHPYNSMHSTYTHENAIVFNEKTRKEGIIERQYAQP
jgi:hypothetical protein